MIFHSKTSYKARIIIFVSLLLLTGCSLQSSFSKKITGFDCDNFYPVCGEDEITYYNQCQADEREAEIVYDGACNGTDIETIPYDRAIDTK
jgi:hypothetical protein